MTHTHLDIRKTALITSSIFAFTGVSGLLLLSIKPLFSAIADGADLTEKGLHYAQSFSHTHHNILLCLILLTLFLFVAFIPLPAKSLTFLTQDLAPMITHGLHTYQSFCDHTRYARDLWISAFVLLLGSAFILFFCAYTTTALELSLAANMLRLGKTNSVSYALAGITLFASFLFA